MNMLRIFRPTEKDKRYFAALLVVIGVVFFWRGVWDTTYLIPIIDNPFISLFIGLVIITFTGVIFSEFDPMEARTEKTIDLLHTIMRHKETKNRIFTLKYFDLIAKKHFKVHHYKIDKIERNYVVIEEKGKEIFIPVHRIEEIRENNKILWKKK